MAIRAAVALTAALAAALAVPATAPAQRGAVLPRPLHAEPDERAGGRLVDDLGREVLLRGVNVNTLVEYARSPFTAFPSTFALARTDPARMSRMGLNAVRLAISWSRVEPQPGRYDAAYLRRVAALARTFASEGLATLVDLHQDAWGPTLAAPAGTVCGEGQQPALGWDGAPGWATLAGASTARCTAGELRESSPAVLEAWAAFWADRDGPGGVGIQTRYARMLSHVARTLARRPGIVGYDVLNEPGAVGEQQNAALSRFYALAARALRAGERAGRGPRRLVLFEPSVLWSATGRGAPPRFAADRDIVYAPHVYAGGFTNGPITRPAFDVARDEARAFGGAPVLTGEWGADPDRAAERGVSYFTRHQDLQDELRFGATLWTWFESCGDAHKAADFRAGRLPEVWGVFNVSCTDNVRSGLREPLVNDLTRGRVRAAPGRLRSMRWSSANVLRASGAGARRASGPLVAWHPGRELRVTARGLRRPRLVPFGGGRLILAEARGSRWSLVVRPR